MKPFTISAPGKLHLLGEHTVVYNKPALIAAINKRCFVRVTPRKDRSIVCTLDNFGVQASFLEKNIIAKTLHTQKAWEAYAKKPGATRLRSIISSPMDFVVVAIGTAIREFGPIPCGFDMKLSSEIPVGSGMGSSAAAAVALAGSMVFLYTKQLDGACIGALSHQIEQYVHGNSSGADTAASIAGGVVLFTKNKPVQRVILSEKIKKTISVIFTGKPEETTGEMVESVRALYKKDTAWVQKIFDAQEMLVQDLVRALKEGDTALCRDIFREGEKNLEKLGVVSKSTKKLIRSIEHVGGAAKISGAGGKKKFSGGVLVLCENIKEISNVVKSMKLSYFTSVMGEKGIRKEKDVC